MIFKYVSEGHCGHRVATGLDKNSGGRGPVMRLSKCTMMAETRAKAWRTCGQMWKCVDI